MTTARVMGQQVIDAAVRLLGEHAGVHGVPGSRTHRVPLSGGDPVALAEAQRISGSLPVDPAIKERWLSLYGGNFLKLVDIVKTDPAAASDLEASHITLAEVRYTVGEEMAMTLTDFFTRRASVFY